MLHVLHHALVELREDAPVHVHRDVVADSDRFRRLDHLFGRGLVAGEDTLQEEAVEEVESVFRGAPYTVDEENRRKRFPKN